MKLKFETPDITILEEVKLGNIYKLMNVQYNLIKPKWWQILLWKPCKWKVEFTFTTIAKG